MGKLPTIQVVHPADPSRFIVINKSAFDPAVHTPWEDRHAEPDAPVLPDGYEAKHRGGGKYIALVDGRPLKSDESDDPALFDDKAAAEAALAVFAEAAQADA